MLKTSGPDYKKIKLEAQKLIGQGKYQEALNRLIELSRQINDPEVYNSIGDLYIRFQNNELALQYLEKAYKIYREQDFREIAISVAKKILRLDKDRYDIYLDLVEMELENGNVDKALDWALEFLKLPSPDSSYVGKLFRLVNDMANVIQENTEQASKFERLFLMLQELAEQLSLVTLEAGIEIADTKEFFEKGDFGGYGGFFESSDLLERTKEKRTTKRKEEPEPVEKIEFIEKEEVAEEGYVTASGFSNFLEPEKSERLEKTVFEEEVPLSQPKSEEKVTFSLSEKTRLLEEEEFQQEVSKGKGSKGVSAKKGTSEPFKTAFEEELPEEIEEEQKVWESVTSRKLTERKVDFTIPGDKRSTELRPPEVESKHGLESKEEVEEKPEKLREAFEDLIKVGEGERKVSLDEVIKGKLKKVESKEPELKEKMPPKDTRGAEGGVVAGEKLTSPKGVSHQKSSTHIQSQVLSLSELQADLLRIIRDFKEDLVSMDTWPYSMDSPFDLAREYYEMKLYQPAIEEFQELLNEPRYRLQSMVYLGKIFFEIGELEFAEAILRKALEESGYMEKESIEACYYLALTLEAMKRFMEAKELFMRVYVFDSKYKDVLEKLKILRSRVA